MASVLHLLAPDLPTGTARQVRYLADGLRAQDWRVDLCSFDSLQSRKQRLQRIVSRFDGCHLSLRLDPTFVVRCARYVRAKAPDVVHCWGQHSHPMLRMALRMAGVKRVVWSCRSDAERHSMLALRRSDTVVTNARHLTQAVTSRHDVRTVLNGVRTPLAKHIVSPLYQELDVPPESMFLAAMGDLRPKKHLKDVVWAFDLLRVIRPQLHLLILGTSEMQDDLQAFIRTAMSAEAIHLLGFRDDADSVLRQCAGFWQASSDEGCSNALLEAMALGVPVVASDIAGHREILQGDTLGYITQPGDCAEVARKTNMLLEQRQAADEMAQRAREFVQENYSVGNMVQGYGELYAELLTRHRNAA